MDVNYAVAQMTCQAQAIQALVEGVSDEQARWKPGPDDWSILEVINHLYDEEIEDFRAHLDLVLHHPNEPWSGIDPQGWVTARHYNERELQASLDNLRRARQESLAWLQSLLAPDWQAVRPAPFGEIRAGDMLAAWVAHDLLHMRQLVELHWAYTTQQLQPYGVRYAGVW
jgi:uncharacterized damage-inducible protein DinB